MKHWLLSRRRPRRWMRHIACVATLALQAGIVTSPIWEPHNQKEVHPKPHVEQAGARHLNMHSGATCPVCSVRALASLPTATPPSLLVERLPAAKWLAATTRPSRRDGPTDRSRAPPIAS